MSHEDEDDEDKANPRADDTTDGLEWDLIESVSMMLPCAAETDVCVTDGSPGEKSSKTRKRKEPIKDLSLIHI